MPSCGSKDGSPTKELTPSGISVVGDVPWGTHFCLFYETKQDLLDAAIPYLKTGLERKEYCIWVIPALLTEKEAWEALGQSVSSLERYRAEGSMEILLDSEWYLKGGNFDMRGVEDGWLEKLKDAMAKGYPGMRVTGDASGFGRNIWRDICEYEEWVNHAVADKRVLALCTFPLTVNIFPESPPIHRVPGFMLDALQAHKFATIRRNGQWQAVETPALRASRQAEEALQACEFRFRQLVDLLPVAVYTTDAEGRVTLYNQCAAQLWGRRPQLEKDEWCGSFRLYRPDGSPLPLEECPMATALRELRPVRGEDIIVERPDGSRAYVQPNPEPLRDAKGNLIGAVNVLIDLTQLREKEAALRRQALMLELAPVLVLDLNCEITYWNRGAERLYGFGKEEALGQVSYNLLQTKFPEPLENILTVLCSGQEWRGQLEHTRKDRTRLFIASYWVPHLDARGNLEAVIEVCTDVTERKRAEDQLHIANERLHSLSRQLLEARETERRTISRELHDEIGQAITAVSLALQTAKRTPEASRRAAVLDEGIGILDRVLQQVRDLSLDLRPSMLDDLGLAAAVRWQVDRQSQRAGFEAEVVADEVAARLSPEVEIACYRIVQEALTNVVRHAKARNVRVELRCADSEVHLLILDNGVGFEPSNVLGRPANLGLNGMEELASLLGGQVEVDSAPGRGTTVQARFPLTTR